MPISIAPLDAQVSHGVSGENPVPVDVVERPAAPLPTPIAHEAVSAPAVERLDHARPDAAAQPNPIDVVDRRVADVPAIQPVEQGTEAPRVQPVESMARETAGSQFALPPMPERAPALPYIDDQRVPRGVLQVRETIWLE